LNNDLLKPRHRYLYRKGGSIKTVNEIKSIIKKGEEVFNKVVAEFLWWPWTFLVGCFLMVEICNEIIKLVPDKILSLQNEMEEVKILNLKFAVSKLVCREVFTEGDTRRFKKKNAPIIRRKKDLSQASFLAGGRGGGLDNREASRGGVGGAAALTDFVGGACEETQDQKGKEGDDSKDGLGGSVMEVKFW
jgi:hypothetical protein